MEEEKTDQGKTTRKAEDWVLIARQFGEECVKIQQDSQLNTDQKLEKQRNLGEGMISEIQKDSHLSESDKDQMIASINNYLDEWEKMYKLFQENLSQLNTPKENE